MNLTVTAYESILRNNPDIQGAALPKPRKGHAPDEHEEQAAVVQWAQENEGRWPELRLLFAVPNGGYRDPITAKLLAESGVKAGVPDMLLPCARRDEDGSVLHGLWIELKRRDHSNHPSPEQGVWLSALRREGYRAVVCYGAPEAIDALCTYLVLLRWKAPR
jgi:hypothetical protein